MKQSRKYRVVIVGSTGHLGSQAFSVVQRYPQYFELYGLVGGKNKHELAQQTKKSFPTHSILAERDGMQTICDLIEDPKTDIVIHAMGGITGLLPAWSAVRSGKTLLLANKESLVCAGALLLEEAKRSGARIIPLDSELSALRNCLHGIDRSLIGEVILTCSGGPFWGKSPRAMTKAKKETVLRHPTWTMGTRISVDSATLMNKGFEIIETHVLFDLPLNQIRVLIHPQSVVHAMVTLKTGETRALLAPPDMTIPILAALMEVVGVVLPNDFLSLPAYPSLSFHEPDHTLFPAINIAREAAEKGGTLPAILCTADEVAVDSFLTGKLDFSGIVPMVKDACTLHASQGFMKKPTFEHILQTIYDYRSYTSSRPQHPRAQRQTHDHDRRRTVARTHL